MAEAMMACVLFVDDEPHVLDGIRRTMHEHAGRWESLFAANGDEALAVMERRQVHVVVTDIAMPVMDGHALITRLYESHPEVVALVLSGHWTPALSASKLGPAVRFLGKPISRDRLVAAVRDALGEAVMPAMAAPEPKLSLAAPSHRSGIDPSWLDLVERD